tara:strand:+ start:170 stop:460 length:291 start_codon:yes stop_codon:yes gene_type:complete
MWISLMQRHVFNQTKPICGVGDLEEEVQWDYCDLEGQPPYREPGTMTSHGKIPRYNYEDLPLTFTDTKGKEHLIEDIHSYKSSGGKDMINMNEYLK